jgi:hypothetical protein
LNPDSRDAPSISSGIVPSSLSFPIEYFSAISQKLILLTYFVVRVSASISFAPVAILEDSEASSGYPQDSSHANQFFRCHFKISREIATRRVFEQAQLYGVLVFTSKIDRRRLLLSSCQENNLSAPHRGACSGRAPSPGSAPGCRDAPL